MCRIAGTQTKEEKAMTQDEKWMARYQEYANFIKDNGRCPSKHFEAEHQLHSWWKNNRKLLNAGKMKMKRREMFEKLVLLAESHRHINQYR
jgi:hypothetical protein